MKKYMNPKIEVSVFDSEEICTTASSQDFSNTKTDVDELKSKGVVAALSYTKLVF